MINKFLLESKIHFSNGWKAFNAEGMVCDLDDNAEYIFVYYDNCVDEYKKVADDVYKLISSQ
jgi:hypothetical protein